MRQLASIVEIKTVQHHPNAERLDIVTVLGGWTVCVSRNEFKVGDPAVYIEIDSMVPRRPCFEFLFKDAGTRDRVKIKTIRLRSELSQGILFKPKTFFDNLDSFKIGDDVTEVLDIIKYEAPETTRNINSAGAFPGHLCPKSDETRVQSLEALVQKLQGVPFVATVKLDGSSTTLGCISLEDSPDAFVMASRNLRLYTSEQFTKQFPDNSQAEPSHFEKALLDVNAFKKLGTWCRKNNRLLTLQGECLGPKVQGNKYNLSKFTIRFFNVFDIVTRKYLPFIERERILREMGLPMVPVFNNNFTLPKTADELIQLATSKVAYNCERDVFPTFMDEGLVFTPRDQEIVEVSDIGRLLNANRVSFKAINPLFSEKYSNE